MNEASVTFWAINLREELAKGDTPKPVTEEDIFDALTNGTGRLRWIISRLCEEAKIADDELHDPDKFKACFSGLWSCCKFRSPSTASTGSNRTHLYREECPKCGRTAGKLSTSLRTSL